MAVSIIIVEDSRMVRQRLVKSVKTIRGVEIVGQFEDADGAIQAVRSLSPDVLLLDIHLRQGNGIDVLKAIAAAQPAMKIIVLTNFTEPQYREACIAHGAHHFLDKSTEFDQVPALLAELTGAS